MPTLNQLIRHGREEKRRTDRTRASDQCHQKQVPSHFAFHFLSYGRKEGSWLRFRKNQRMNLRQLMKIVTKIIITLLRLSLISYWGLPQEDFYCMDEPSTSFHHPRRNPLPDLHYHPLEGVDQHPLTPYEIDRANQLDQLRKEILFQVRNLYRAHELPPVKDEREYSIMVDFLLFDIDHPTPSIYLSIKRELELSGRNCERWKSFYKDWTSKEWKPKD